MAFEEEDLSTGVPASQVGLKRSQSPRLSSDEDIAKKRTRSSVAATANTGLTATQSINQPTASSDTSKEIEIQLTTNTSLASTNTNENDHHLSEEIDSFVETSAVESIQPVKSGNMNTESLSMIEVQRQPQPQSAGERREEDKLLASEVPVSTSTGPQEAPSMTAAASASATRKQQGRDPLVRNTRFSVINRCSAVRKPTSDKFLFTSEALEAYSHDSFTAVVDSLIKKSKTTPLDHSHTSSVRRPSVTRNSSSATSHQLRSSQNISQPAAPSTGSTSLPPANNSTGNILDSLLESISKNERAASNSIVPPPSDLQIAMMSAESSQPPNTGTVQNSEKAS